MQKINKHKAIDLILAEMKQGNIDAPVILQKLTKHYKNVKTFYNHYNQAKEIYQERQKPIQKQLDDDYVEQEKERQKKAILSKHERLEIASKIAKGESWKVGKTVMIPNGSDRLKALDYLAKVDGDYMATKTDITTQGEKINNETAVVEILKILKK